MTNTDGNIKQQKKKKKEDGRCFKACQKKRKSKERKTKQQEIYKRGKSLWKTERKKKKAQKNG